MGFALTENEEIKTAQTGFMNSKLAKVFMTIVSVFLVFAGPTYVVYGLAVVVNINGFVAFGVGFVLFVVGLVMMRYLLKNKVIS
jgi:hypothetical protein